MNKKLIIFLLFLIIFLDCKKNYQLVSDTDNLKKTVVVPVLNYPIPDNKNIIWCSDFQIAWNQLKNEINEPVKLLTDNEMFVKYLNESKQGINDLPGGSYYVKSFIPNKDNIKNITKEFKKIFPGESLPDFDTDNNSFIIFSFLKTDIKFKKPFFDNKNDFYFTSANGDRNNILTFGIRDNDRDKYKDLRAQVKILYRSGSNELENEFDEFIIDPCVSSGVNQLVLACIKKKDSLYEMYEYIQKKISEYQKEKNYNYMTEFNISDVLLIPNISFDIKREYNEIAGKYFLNNKLKDLYIDKAEQNIVFNLDKSGVKLKSFTIIRYLSGSYYYEFNKPFLLYIKKRDAKYPFLVIWIDNEELLLKRHE